MLILDGFFFLSVYGDRMIGFKLNVKFGFGEKNVNSNIVDYFKCLVG